LRSNIVSRTRLLAKLDAGRQRPLILVCAPAGFGKTTLLLDWLRHLEKGAGEPKAGQAVVSAIKAGWLSLSQADNDLFGFFTYLAAVLQQFDSRLGQEVRALLKSPNVLLPDRLMTALINDVVTFGQTILLVLDDYHLIKTPEIHQALTFLLDHMPPQMHLVISSRADPPLPLSRLRARNELLEIRPDACRFTVAEGVAFFQQTMALDLSPEVVAMLDERAEGWIAGLQMAALSMEGERDAADFVRRFSGNHRYILDYLGDEVLSHQPADVQHFLLRTAILDQLNGALCDALLYADRAKKPDNGPATVTTAQGMLERLEANNLFITSLDDERRWYRYHHLFTDLLRHKLQTLVPASEIATLHRRAGAWLAEQGALEPALGHALAAGDTVWAAQLVEQHR
jgi:LuxR family maltose regulon positive regulatory protein